ncbi:MAG TPA: ribosome small subunit-dependent GTPase A [Aggregatilineaceae bacterium]|nr:ribosome small subunit-dependent GTPase A [Anaerolineae bacterium]HMM27875.1 ribosome small subunit-dependent GTPase A [Aggregatilineaceae bacterium]
MAERLTGLVIRTQSGFFTVQTDEGAVVAQLRGRLKEAYTDTDLVALGDRVTIERLPVAADQVEAVIVAVAERERVLSRVAPSSAVGTSAEREQVIIANPDQAIFVFAAADPAPHTRMLDRFLVAAEKAAIPEIRVCLNKIDLLADRAEIADKFGVYERIGYPVLYVSAKTGEGLDALREALAGKISVFTGPSGVGKTSLLNAIEPDLGRRVNAVSHATTKGRHTTRYSELVPLAGGGYIADTPGIRAISPWDVEPDELDGYYIEIAPHVAECRFQDCTHTHEPGCGVRAALARGEIAPERYNSYLRLREELEEQYVY